MRAARSWLAPLLTLVMIVLVIFALRDKASLFSSAAFLKAVKTIPVERLLASAGFTCLYYLVIVGYDALAFSAIRIAGSRRTIALASVVSFAYTNAIGFGAVTNASMRYHVHKHGGVSLKDSTKVSAFYGLTLLLGMFCVGGVVFLWGSITLPSSLHLPLKSTEPIGWTFLALTAVYVILLTRPGKPIRIWKWALPRLPLWTVALQVVLASADWTVSGAAAYVLLPHGWALPFTQFLSIYLLAQFAGMVSQVPGGIGVFETIMLLFIPRRVSATVTIGALLAFRAIFYVIPFLLATVLLGRFEWKSHRRTLMDRLRGR